MSTGSGPPSGTDSPRSFTSQNATAEDLLNSKTVGLVNLADYRKRRADIAEQREKDAHEQRYGRLNSGVSGTATPNTDESDGALTPRDDGAEPPPRKKKRKTARGLLSFGDDEQDQSDIGVQLTKKPSRNRVLQQPEDPIGSEHSDPGKRRLMPNAIGAIPPPKATTKASLQAEAAARDALRKKFVKVQELVKNTEILVPFVFYDGTNIPAGSIKIKKGDHIWFFLEKSRKMGAELGVGGAGAGSSVGVAKSKDESRRAWARVGVDDLMCVRGDVIVPHHYEIYYFIANKVANPTQSEEQLFNYTNTAPNESEEAQLLLRTPKSEVLEGHDHDPNLTKVVDRRWYERNKHIYPASLWKEFEQGKDFVKAAQARKDAQGNSFFY